MRRVLSLFVLAATLTACATRPQQSTENRAAPARTPPLDETFQARTSEGPFRGTPEPSPLSAVPPPASERVVPPPLLLPNDLAPDQEPVSMPILGGPTLGSKVTATASFVEQDDRVRVVVRVAGAEPGKYAVHFHATSDCAAPDHPERDRHRLGATRATSLGTLAIQDDGTGTLSGSFDLAARKQSLVGSAIAVYRGEQRLACGLVTR